MEHMRAGIQVYINQSKTNKGIRVTIIYFHMVNLFYYHRKKIDKEAKNLNWQYMEMSIAQ